MKPDFFKVKYSALIFLGEFPAEVYTSFIIKRFRYSLPHFFLNAGDTKICFIEPGVFVNFYNRIRQYDVVILFHWHEKEWVSNKQLCENHKVYSNFLIGLVQIWPHYRIFFFFANYYYVVFGKVKIFKDNNKYDYISPTYKKASNYQIKLYSDSWP